MKKIKFLLVLLVGLTFTSCLQKVPAGRVGIKFYLLGTSKGVDHEVKSPGRYWIGINEELYLFPTFTQNYVWTKSEEDKTSRMDESFDFQDKEGLGLNADIGITYKLDKSKIPLIFQTYKRGIDEITDVFLRNMVRDGLVNVSSKLDAEYIYGEGRTAVLDKVEEAVKKEVAPLGIKIEKLYWIGKVRLPESIKEAIDMKIKATQKSQQIENEVAQSEAQASKDIAKAYGEARSKFIIDSTKAVGNRLLNASLTPNLLKYKKLEKWDGKLPQVSGANALVNLK